MYTRHAVTECDPKYGPRTKHVVALIERLKKVDWTSSEAVRNVSRGSVWSPLWDVSRSSGRYAAWLAAQDELPDATWGVTWDIMHLVRICIVWDVLNWEQLSTVLDWLGPIAEELGETPDELMNKPTTR